MSSTVVSLIKCMYFILFHLFSSNVYSWLNHFTSLGALLVPLSLLSWLFLNFWMKYLTSELQFLLPMYLPFQNKHLGWRQVYCVKYLPEDSGVTFLLLGFHHYQYFSPTMWRSKIYSNAFFFSVN